MAKETQVSFNEEQSKIKLCFSDSDDPGWKNASFPSHGSAMAALYEMEGSSLSYTEIVAKHGGKIVDAKDRKGRK